jgi:creatinine amidohydrolase/Fe(II)-dependent formamide hydrolase-like protein
VVGAADAISRIETSDLRRSRATTAGMSRAGGTPLGPAMYVGWMGGMGGSEHGIMGDPTVVTAEKGKKWLNIAAENLAQFILDWKKMPINPAVDHH